MYPIWEVPYFSAGIILALIATFHILPSHFSTGAMWFNIYIETKAYRENKPELLEFIKKYSLLLLIFSYVFGSLSGIGIWYSVTVANPRGISALIHNYVWAWATEWIFFIIEVVGIFIYYYTLNKIDKKTHLKLGWIFAIASWITMIVIVGIIAFMLSPGKWHKTGNFFDGFFNQTYWPQLFMRTSLMFCIAATYAIATATRLQNNEIKSFVARLAAKWGITGIILGTIFFLWYLKVLPEHSRNLLNILAPKILKTGMMFSSFVLLLYFIYAMVKPLTIRLVPAIIAIVVIFVGIWSTERTREIIRKPYIIPQYMYSNQIIGDNIPAKGIVAQTKIINEKGVLKVAPFVPANLRNINDNNLLQTGRMITLIECSSCHVLTKKGLRPLPKMLERVGFKEVDEIESFLDMLSDYSYMPPFMGTAMEKKALATYLVSLNK